MLDPLNLCVRSFFLKRPFSAFKWIYHFVELHLSRVVLRYENSYFFHPEKQHRKFLFFDENHQKSFLYYLSLPFVPFVVKKSPENQMVFRAIFNNSNGICFLLHYLLKQILHIHLFPDNSMKC